MTKMFLEMPLSEFINRKKNKGMDQIEYKNIKGEKWTVEKGDWISSQKLEDRGKRKFFKTFRIYAIGFLLIIISVVFAVTFLFTL